MSTESMWWLGLNFVTILGLGYYSMMEMACVSLSKIRLHYHVSKGSQRAKWVYWLLENPSRLFGTTLIGVNVMMMVGSECSREFHRAIGISPDWAPLSQIIVVIIIGELAPMFAARRFPEHVTMLGIPLLYLTAKLMQPVLWAIHGLTWLISKLFGTHDGEEVDLYLNREELQKILEDSETSPHRDDDMTAMVSSIFSLRNMTAADLMVPLKSSQLVPANSSVGHLRHLLQNRALPYLPIFHRNESNIVGIAFPRDYLRARDHETVRSKARSPWFLIETSSILEVLAQFRQNNQTVAVVLNNSGKAVGLLTLDTILWELFHVSEESLQSTAIQQQGVIEKTFSGQATVGECEEEMQIELQVEPKMTLAKLVSKTLGHPPIAGDHVLIGDTVILVKEASLFEAKSLLVTAVMREATEEDEGD